MDYTSKPRPTTSTADRASASDLNLAELKVQLDFEKLLSDISSKLVSLDYAQVNESIPGILKEVSEFIQVDFSTFLQVDPSSGQIQHTDQWVAPHVNVKIDFIDFDLKMSAPWVAEKLTELKPIAISNVNDIPREAVKEKNIAEQLGLKSILWVPISVSGKFAGCIALNSLRQKIYWTEALISRLVLLGEIVSDNLQRSHNEKLLKESEQNLIEAYAEIKQLKEDLEVENFQLRRDIAKYSRKKNIVGNSRALKDTLSQVRQVAVTNATVLLLGETGTGKELIANEIHLQSKCRGKPMVTVNCAALPEQLIESELFGHEKGAYTGATAKKIGRFELADGSTIFLDEVGDLPVNLQVKLLRVLQEGEFERLGSNKTIHVNVRIIAATNRPLENLVQKGAFRPDLYYRLNVFPIIVPPLRDHIEDIEPMVTAFVKEFEEHLGKHIEHIPKETLQSLMSYSWPGNVRELHNVVERAIILSEDSTLRVNPLQETENQSYVAMSLEEVERQHILSVLERFQWKISGPSGAAQALDLKPTTLRSKLDRLGIDRPKSK